MNRSMIFSLLASACCGFFVPPAGPIEDCIHRSMNNHKFIRPTLHSQGFYNLNTIESAYSLFCYFVQYSALTYSIHVHGLHKYNYQTMHAPRLNTKFSWSTSLFGSTLTRAKYITW